MDRQNVERARLYMQKLANGINPLDDSMVPEQELINHVRISRCFFFVADVLGQVLKEEPAAPPKVKKTPFALPFGMREGFAFSQEPITVSEITQRINDLIDAESMKKLPTTAITGWLKASGLLQVQADANGRKRTIPTPQGKQMGIFTQDRVGKNGPYVAVTYGLNMQRFILDNLEGAIQLATAHLENEGKPWSVEDDAQLRNFLALGTPVKEMGKALKRTTTAVRARLRKLGLI